MSAILVTAAIVITAAIAVVFLARLHRNLSAGPRPTTAAIGPTRRISSAGVILRIPRDWHASTAQTSGCDPQRLVVASSAPLHVTAGALPVPAPHQVEIVVLEDHKPQDRPLSSTQRPNRFAIDWNRRIRLQGCPDGLPTAVYTRWFRAHGRYLGFIVYAGTAVTQRTRDQSSAVLNSVAVPSREPSLPRLLAGNGIGAVHFGETPTNVDSELARLLGRPGGTYTPSICGLDHESYWFGLDARPTSSRGVHLFRAQLFVYFKHSRFVGYVYNDDQAISRSTLNDETHIPLNSPQGSEVLRGPRLTLAMANGVAPGDPLTQARRVYGQAFVETTQAQGTPPNPRLGRAPIWEIETPNGRLYGWIDNTQTANSFYENARRSIASIAAGETPNTPCH